MAVGKLKVLYRLTSEGRRKMLLLGKEAHPNQEIVFDVEIDDEIIKMSSIDSSGMATIDLSSPVSVGGFYSITHPFLDEPILEPKQALEQMALFKLEMEKTLVKAKEREDQIERNMKDKEARTQKDLIAYARYTAAQLERKYGTMVWTSIMDFNGTEREAFDQLVKDFKKEYEHKEEQKKREKAEAEKRIWIQKFGSEQLRIEHETGIPCQARYVRERVLTEIGTGWYVDPNKKVEHEPPKTISGTARQMTEILRRIGMNPKITWLPKGLVRGEPPENEGVEGLEYDEFRPYDDPAWPRLPSLGGCECIIIENYLGRYDLFYPVGPKALTEGIGKFVKEAQWMKGEGEKVEEERA